MRSSSETRLVAAGRTSGASNLMARWRAEIRTWAEIQGGVVTRRQLYRKGVTRGEVRANLRAERWQTVGTHCIAVHSGALGELGRCWGAVLEGGPRAFLDGESSLLAAGLKNYTVGNIRVSVPRGARVRRTPTLNVRQTRRWRADDMSGDGVPRTRSEVAAVRAALWAKSDRQAALLLSMVVQQHIATAEEIGLEMLKVKRDRRRALVHGVLLDLLDGAGSLGELDFARECRRRGLPEPSRQVLRKGHVGQSYYLDVHWDQWGVAVEIDGIQHSWAQNVVSDAIRHNNLSIGLDIVLRLPLLGLRLAPDDFFDQIARALRHAGFTIPASALRAS